MSEHVIQLPPVVDFEGEIESVIGQGEGVEVRVRRPYPELTVALNELCGKPVIVSVRVDDGQELSRLKLAYE